MECVLADLMLIFAMTVTGAPIVAAIIAVVLEMGDAE